MVRDPAGPPRHDPGEQLHERRQDDDGDEARHLAEASSFERHRPPLFSIAYRMLGGVVDAGDTAQETYLRWRSVGDDARSPKACLSTVVTRLSID